MASRANLLFPLRHVVNLDHSFVLTPDGRHVAVSYNSTIYIYNLSTTALVRTIEGHTDHVCSLTVTSDSQHLVSASYDRTARVWLLDSGAEVHVLEHLGAVHSVALSPDNQLIVTGIGYLDYAVHVWRMADGSLVWKMKGHTDSVCSLAVSPNGLHVVSGSFDSTARIWQLTDGALQREIKHPDWVLSVAVTPDSQHVLTGCGDSFMRLFLLTTGVLVREFKVHSDTVRHVAVSSSGQCIVYGFFERTVRVWSLADARAPLVLTGHTNNVRSVAFHPNGKQVASASADGTIRLWTVCEWSDRDHQLFGQEFKALVFFLMCIKVKLDSEQIITRLLPRLPMAVWLQVFAFLQLIF